MRKSASSLFVLIFVALWHQAAAQDDLGNAHLTIENPSTQPPDQIERIYDGLKERMAQGYALSRLPFIDDYQSWRRYNTAPYLSATHGQRFVNNYANPVGEVYGSLTKGEEHPAGTILVKDAVTVTDEGRSFPGALFVMEKLASGTRPKTADWRYIVVNPDGSLFGDTIGDEPQLVDYCHTCHAAKANRDYVFGVPEAFRVRP